MEDLSYKTKYPKTLQEMMYAKIWEKVKFTEFWGSTDGQSAEAWLENMAMCFTLRDYTSNMKAKMGIFQLKGNVLL